MNSRVSNKDTMVVFDNTSIEQRVDTLFKFKQALSLQSRNWTHLNLGYNGCVQFQVHNHPQIFVRPKRKDFSLSQNNRAFEEKSQNTLLLNIIFIDIKEFKKFSSLQKFQCHILEFIQPSRKNIIMLECVSEWLQANDDCESFLELSKFLLCQQMDYGVDYILCGNQEQSCNKLTSLLESVQSKYMHYDQDLYHDKKIIISGSEFDGLTNFYQQNLLAMLSQIHGISQDKAIQIVQAFPSVKKLTRALNHYEQDIQNQFKLNLNEAQMYQLRFLMTSYDYEKTLFQI